MAASTMVSLVVMTLLHMISGSRLEISKSETVSSTLLQTKTSTDKKIFSREGEAGPEVVESAKDLATNAAASATAATKKVEKHPDEAAAAAVGEVTKVAAKAAAVEKVMAEDTEVQEAAGALANAAAKVEAVAEKEAADPKVNDAAQAVAEGAAQALTLEAALASDREFVDTVSGGIAGVVAKGLADAEAMSQTLEKSVKDVDENVQNVFKAVSKNPMVGKAVADVSGAMKQAGESVEHIAADPRVHAAAEGVGKALGRVAATVEASPAISKAAKVLEHAVMDKGPEALDKGLEDFAQTVLQQPGMMESIQGVAGALEHVVATAKAVSEDPQVVAAAGALENADKSLEAAVESVFADPAVIDAVLNVKGALENAMLTANDPRLASIAEGVGKGLVDVVGKALDQAMKKDPNIAQAAEAVGKAFAKAAAVANAEAEDPEAVEAFEAVEEGLEKAAAAEKHMEQDPAVAKALG